MSDKYNLICIKRQCTSAMFIFANRKKIITIQIKAANTQKKGTGEIPNNLISINVKSHCILLLSSSRFVLFNFSTSTYVVHAVKCVRVSKGF